MHHVNVLSILTNYKHCPKGDFTLGGISALPIRRFLRDIIATKLTRCKIEFKQSADSKVS